VRWRELLDELTCRLGATEAAFVIEAATGVRTSSLVAVWNETADPTAIEAARTIADRVGRGEPLQHVLGGWGFRTLDLRVDSRALIPRPETEVLVGHALTALDRTRSRRRLALDLGVGSGAIACALVAERDALEVVGVDRSTDALALAAENRAFLGPKANRLRLVASDWYSAFGSSLDGRVALIVSNPPYLSDREWHDAPAIVREWDPRGALVGGAVGTEAIAEVLAGASRLLIPGGALVLEIGATQADAVRVLATQAGAVSVAVEQDLAQRDRVVVVSW
jgi:release factor glutamine methyltransferase